MFLTFILGAMACKQKQDGERVHAVASLHAPFAIGTVLSLKKGLLQGREEYTRLLSPEDQRGSEA